ncbi:MAG: helix-turn-helix domain-containing protein [Clostridia bacterium]|nr:helix-turn-helix domain-containing protein [Clostridia bacterium]
MVRIKELRKKHKITAKQLGEIINVAESTMSLYENGKREPDYETLVKIADYFKVSTDYLLGRNESPISDILPSADNIFRIEKKRFPLLGEIACGEPIYADEEHESYILAGSDLEADFCLRAKGDSMINARILDGDIVFIKKTPMVNNGEIAAVIIDEEATLKRVYYYAESAKLILTPENPKYEPLVYVGEELNSIRIIGKAVAFHSVVR